MTLRSKVAWLTAMVLVVGGLLADGIALVAQPVGNDPAADCEPQDEDTARRAARDLVRDYADEAESGDFLGAGHTAEGDGFVVTVLLDRDAESPPECFRDTPVRVVWSEGPVVGG